MKRIIAFLMMILSVVIIAGCGTETASPNATHKSIFHGSGNYYKSHG